MSGAAGPGVLPGLRRGELVAKTPGRCVGPSRSGRGVRRPWEKRRGAGTSRGRGGRRRARSSVRETRCVSAERLQDCRRPWGRRPAAGTAQAAGANKAAGTPGTAVLMEVARDLGTVWVNGAVGEPQVVGPVGSVWVTGTGEEEETAYRSPRGCERKGRPGSTGHESILELWLKVQAMRAASGCGEGSRVELHPVSAGEGPVERGVPGRASWVETSCGGLTGPWVKGQDRPVPRAAGVAIAPDLGAGCERASDLCGQGQAVRMPPVAVPGTLEASSGIAPHPRGRRQDVAVPGPVEGIGYGVAPGSWGKGSTGGVPGATVGWPEAVEVPRAVEGEPGGRAAPGLRGREQAAQAPVCGDTPGLGGRGRTAGVPRAAREETPSVGAPAAWRRRQAVEETDAGRLPGLWGTGQPIGVSCATGAGARCRGEPGFGERGQAVWVETGSGGDFGSRKAAQPAEVSGPDEQEAGPGGATGLWDIGQAMGVPRPLGPETGCGSVWGLWGTEQPVRVSQAPMVAGAVGEWTIGGGVPGLWARQQALGAPPADAVTGAVGEETCGGNVLSLWERRWALGGQEALVPAALGGPGSVDQEAGCGDASCPCMRRQAAGLSEAVGSPEAAGVSKHRSAPAGAPTAVCKSGSGSVPARVPAAVWVSGSVCQEGGSRDDLNLWGEVRTTRIPLASGVPVAPQELWSVGEDTGCEASPGSWGRRQSARVPVAAEVPMASRVPGPLGVETGPGGFSCLPGRGQTAGVLLTAGVSTAAGAPGPLVGDASSGGGSGAWRRRHATEVPTAARASGPGNGETDSEGVAGLWRRRADGAVPGAVRVPLSLGVLAAVGVPTAGRRPAAVWVTGSAGEDPSMAVSSFTAGRRPSTEGPGAPGWETGGRSVLGLPGGVSYTCGRGTRLWSCPRSAGEEPDSENVPGVSRTGTAWGVNEAEEVPPVSREETGIGHLRDHAQQGGRRQAAGGSRIRGRGNNLGENCEGEDRLRGAFQ
ncbi:collagen, type I, alpha 1b [Phocoena phocoena]|uniref:collagen, type I, alpha 1b n=1 Tax=Phocoena phocoena TaxID=9742 RepID=UPI003306E48D